MFVITNREIVQGAKGLKQLGARTNPEGPAVLRLVEVLRKTKGLEVKVLQDKISPQMKAEVGIEDKGDVYASAYVYKKLLAIVNPASAGGARRKGKNLLLFVHGFNNDFEAVVERSELLAKTYGVEVVAFTWPADGGGIKGATNYLDDKRDAQASVVAFDRTLDKIQPFIAQARRGYLDEIAKGAAERFRDSSERQSEFIARGAEALPIFRQFVAAQHGELPVRAHAEVIGPAWRQTHLRQHRHGGGGREQSRSCRMGEQDPIPQSPVYHHQRR